jgi:hypothetical protein
MLGGLRSSTAGDEDGLIFFVGAVRPEQMKVSAASLGILPLPLIFFQIFNGRRIGIAVVEIADFAGYIEW